MGQLGDDRALAAGADEIGRRFDLGAHAAGTQLLAGEHVIGLGQRQPADALLVRRTERAVHAGDVGEDQEHRCADLPAENRGDAILVDHRVDSLQAELRVAIHRCAAATAGHHDMPFRHERANHLVLHHRRRTGARRHAAPPSRLFLGDRLAARLEPRDLHGRERMPDRLGGGAEIGVVGRALGLGDQRDHGAIHRGARQRVLERLLDHVPHPPRRRGDQDAERQRLDLFGRQLIARQVIAHLRAVAVHQDDAPAPARQIHDRRQALARMAELVRNGRALVGRCDCIPAQRHDDRARLHGGAT